MRRRRSRPFGTMASDFGSHQVSEFCRPRFGYRHISDSGLPLADADRTLDKAGFCSLDLRRQDRGSRRSSFCLRPARLLNAWVPARLNGMVNMLWTTKRSNLPKSGPNCFCKRLQETKVSLPGTAIVGFFLGRSDQGFLGIEFAKNESLNLLIEGASFPTDNRDLMPVP